MAEHTHTPALALAPGWLHYLYTRHDKCTTALLPFVRKDGGRETQHCGAVFSHNHLQGLFMQASVFLHFCLFFAPIYSTMSMTVHFFPISLKLIGYMKCINFFMLCLGVVTIWIIWFFTGEYILNYWKWAKVYCQETTIFLVPLTFLCVYSERR